jgi:hypothetical protein
MGISGYYKKIKGDLQHFLLKIKGFLVTVDLGRVKRQTFVNWPALYREKAAALERFCVVVGRVMHV